MFISGNARYSDIPAYSQFSNSPYDESSPVEELRYRRTVHYCYKAPIGYGVSWSPMRSDYIISRFKIGS